MKKVEALLKEKSKKYETLEVPDELEESLRAALHREPKEHSLKSRKWLPAVAMWSIAILLIGGNFSTFAYYGKRLMGYDTVMNGQLQELNDLGKGQIIDKSHTFSNGVTVTLDGIMLDDTQLLTFYTIYSPMGDVDDLHIGHEIKGLFKTYRQYRGQGECDEARQKMKWMMAFDAIDFYEKDLSFRISLGINGFLEEGSIKFTLEREKAMGHLLKQPINQKFQMEDTSLKINDLVAAPTRTIVTGTLQDSLDLLKKRSMKEGFRPIEVSLAVKANGELLEEQGGNISTNLEGTKFRKEFAALPQPLISLELIVESFTIQKNVEEILQLEKSGPWEMMIEGQKVVIDKVESKDNDTLITLTTKDSVLLSQVYLEVDGKKVELERTDESELLKTEEGIFHTRVLKFPAVGEKLNLIVQKINYPEIYNQTVTILIK
ncbi:DUF4179 domain-containing protein [Sporanaerobium hydrogeniformans]|uniref:DUF4179 domain-containing protein n=1 Tax=Sporanaerobium hydrogeniformans TaxID=3072179 RepID=UPI0015D4BB08|nr:DUF4179 domain-containing protein [Sporanaerobium hydrogeniformans]